MSNKSTMIEVWRGDVLESSHCGDAVVVDQSGQVVAQWGDGDRVILPRSACKMLQALPLVDSGAADRAGLGTEQLALACASHSGEAMHVSGVQNWLASMGMSEADLRCGTHWPSAKSAANDLVRAGDTPNQCHNNCSGKHTGFLTLSHHLGAGADYIDIDHPVQRAVRNRLSDLCGEQIGRYAIDGCSAPNFALSLRGLAYGAAQMGGAGAAMRRLVDAMKTHPELIAGTGRACSELTRAASGRTVLKTGAEGVYLAILPERGLGVALKIDDGATRAAEAAIAQILCNLAVLNADDPRVIARRNPTLRNRAGKEVGYIQPSADFAKLGSQI